MKPPKGPFWAWTDIDGTGERWRLAFVTQGECLGDRAIIHYPMDDFEDYWYEDDWEPDMIRLIRPPKSEP